MSISIPSKTPLRFSALPWPNWCSLSAGWSDTLTLKNATMEATRSMMLWMASAIRLTLPVISPAAIFSSINVVFEAIDIAAALVFPVANL